MVAGIDTPALMILGSLILQLLPRPIRVIGVIRGAFFETP